MNFKKIFSEWKWSILGFILIIVLAIVVRIVNLTSLPIFVDEAIYVRWSQVMSTEATLRFLPLSDGKQPLYMWVLMFLIKYFQDPLFIGRLISVMTGIGTLAGIFTLSNLIFNSKKTALLSSFIYAISPFAVFFDRMALVDSMLSMFGVWTAVFGFLTAKYKRYDLAMLTGFMLGFASLTKSPALFIALLLPTFWYLNGWKSFWKIGISYTIAFVMYNVLRLGPNFDLLSSRTGDYMLPLSHVFSNTFDPLIPHLKDFGVWILSIGPSSIVLILLLAIAAGWKKYKKEILVLLTWVIVPVVVQAELGVTYTARYVYFVMPFLFVLSGLLFFAQSKIVRILSLILLAAFLIQSLIFDYHLLTNPEKANLSRGERSGYLEEWTAGQGIKEVSEYLKSEESNNPGKQIVVGTEGYFGTLPDGLHIYVNKYPNILVIGVGVIIEDTPKSLIDAVNAGNKTYLVINKSRFRGDYEKQGFKLIARYPKALRLTDSDQYAKFGPQEELLFFELMN